MRACHAYLALAAGVVIACNDRPPGSGVRGPEGGVLTFDAAMIPPFDGGAVRRDGGTPRDGGDVVADGGRDAGGPLDGFPDVPRMHVGHPDWNPVTLLTHAVVQDAETDFEQIFIVVRNDDPTVTFCSIVFRVEFFDAGGDSITFRTGTIKGDPRSLFTVDADCIPPGVTGLGYGNASWLLPIEDVARIEYYFNGSGGFGSDVRTIASVSNEDQMIVDPYGGGSFWAVSGRLRVTSGSLRYPDVLVFPLDARGLPYDRLTAIELINLYAGSTWPYTTTSAEARFTDYLSALSYRGTSSALAAGSVETRAALAARDRYDAEASAAERRAARF